MTHKKKTFWPWGIAIAYSIFFVTLITFFIFSTQLKTNLVTEDYYQQGINYQQQINRINRTNKLEKSLKWDYNSQSQIVKFVFPVISDSQVIESKIIFFRPADKSQDKEFIFKLSTGVNIQDINVADLARGLWKIKAYWSIDGESYYNEGNIVL